MALAAVGMEGDRDLGRARARERGLDDHLRRELHPRAAQVQAVVQLAGEGRASRSTRRGAGLRNHVRAMQREHGVARASDARTAWRPAATTPPPEGSRQPWTSSWPVAELLDEARDLAEVVAVVGVAHHHEPAARAARCPSSARCRTRARGRPPRRAPRPRAISTRAVGAAVVGDDDLAEDARPRQRRPAPSGCRRRGCPLRSGRAGPRRPRPPERASPCSLRRPGRHLPDLEQGQRRAPHGPRVSAQQRAAAAGQQDVVGAEGRRGSPTATRAGSPGRRSAGPPRRRPATPG